jgi:hypothetical protein
MVGTSNRQARGTASLQDDGAVVAILVEHGGVADLIVPDNTAEMQEAISRVVEAVLVLDVRGAHRLAKLAKIEPESEVDGVTGELVGTEANLAEVHLDNGNVPS